MDRIRRFTATNEEPEQIEREERAERERQEVLKDAATLEQACEVLARRFARPWSIPSLIFNLKGLASELKKGTPAP